MLEQLTDDIFEELAGNTPNKEYTVVPAGHYRLKCLDASPVVTTSKAGNLMLNVRLAPIATKDGDEVAGKVIYHAIPFTGVNKNGQRNAGMFISLFKALGFEKDQITALYESAQSAEVADSVSKDAPKASLSIAGEPVSLEGLTCFGSLKIEEYNGTEKNKISSVWA